MAQATQRQTQLTKPQGALGRLEQLAIQLAGWQGNPQPGLKQVWISVSAGDHGVAVEGVSTVPQAVTGQMLRNFASGGAAISVLARELGATLDLRELHFGEWEGRHASELMVEHADALGRFWADPYGFTPPQAEPLVLFEERVLGAIEALYQRRAGEHLLVITHAGVMRLLMARARGLARKDLLQVEVSHGQRLRIQVESDGSLHECLY